MTKYVLIFSFNRLYRSTTWYDFEDAHVDVHTNDDDTGDTTGQGNIPAAPAAAGANGPTNFNLRVEQNKIPEFFGAKSKDTISAADFIRWLEDLEYKYA